MTHVGQSGELVQVPSLSFQLGQYFVQTLHLHDLLAQAAEAQVVRDGLVYDFRTRLDDRLCPRRHPEGDDLCFLFSRHSCSFLPFRGWGTGQGPETAAGV